MVSLFYDCTRMGIPAEVWLGWTVDQTKLFYEERKTRFDRLMRQANNQITQANRTGKQAMIRFTLPMGDL